MEITLLFVQELYPEDCTRIMKFVEIIHGCMAGGRLHDQVLIDRRSCFFTRDAALTDTTVTSAGHTIRRKQSRRVNAVPY